MLDSFLYQYLVGGAVFAAGIAAGLATNQLSLRAGPGRRRLIWLCAGLLVFFVLQGAFVLYGK